MKTINIFTFNTSSTNVTSNTERINTIISDGFKGNEPNQVADIIKADEFNYIFKIISSNLKDIYEEVRQNSSTIPTLATKQELNTQVSQINSIVDRLKGGSSVSIKNLDDRLKIEKSVNDNQRRRLDEFDKLKTSHLAEYQNLTNEVASLSNWKNTTQSSLTNIAKTNQTNFFTSDQVMNSGKKLQLAANGSGSSQQYYIQNENNSFKIKNGNNDLINFNGTTLESSQLKTYIDSKVPSSIQFKDKIEIKKLTGGEKLKLGYLTAGEINLQEDNTSLISFRKTSNSYELSFSVLYEEIKKIAKQQAAVKPSITYRYHKVTSSTSPLKIPVNEFGTSESNHYSLAWPSKPSLATGEWIDQVELRLLFNKNNSSTKGDTGSYNNALGINYIFEGPEYKTGAAVWDDRFQVQTKTVFYNIDTSEYLVEISASPESSSVYLWSKVRKIYDSVKYSNPIHVDYQWVFKIGKTI